MGDWLREERGTDRELPTRGRTLATEIIGAMRGLGCGMMVVSEGRFCKCGDIEGSVQSNLLWDGGGALAGESRKTTRPRYRRWGDQ